MKLNVFSRSLSILSAVLTIASAGILHAATLSVCPAGPPTCDYSVIQDAIDNATSGVDTVEVRAGTYNENITMKDGVDVLNDPPDVPVIDADGTNPAVTFNGAFSTGCTLSGFEVKDGGSDGGIYLHGSGAGIGNATMVSDCDVYGNSGPGIKVDGATALTAPTIHNNDIRNNSEDGIYVTDAGSSTEDLIIKNNNIYNHDTVGKAGINIGGDSYVTVGPNNHIYENKEGIAFNMPSNSSTQPVTITNNDIELNDTAGISVGDAITGAVSIANNDIYSNNRGGIGIQNSCTLEITKNTIRDNIRGGIHTGTDVANDYFSDSVGFIGGPGSADVTITKNKVYHNGQSNYGGGIDVRHASGTITNNLVYENYRGGIRFGWENAGDDHITDIKHNTVVNNGNHPTYDSDYGGGIIYDDLSGNVNDPPQGSPPGKLIIKNNICTHNEKAGIRACFDMTSGSEERDYNLVYANYPWDDVHGWTNPPDCGWYPDGVLDKMSCANQQYGGCGSAFGTPEDPGPWPYLFCPNDIMDDPLFTNMSAHVYTLDTESPAKTGGQGGVEMGVYGGSDPLDW